MSNAKHTPGPWYYGRTNSSERIILGGPSRKYVANVTVHQLPRQAGLDDELEREANARLITAAPDLLEALEALLANVECDPALECELCDQARSAIAKAKGGEQGGISQCNNR